METDIDSRKPPAITAIGIANPPFKQPQVHTAELIATAFQLAPAEKRLLKSVYKATGIENRYSVLSDYCKSPGEFEFFPNHLDDPFPTTAARMKIYKNNALPLALSAIKNCLAELHHFNKSEITHLISVSCTGMYAPGLDIEIVHHLNLNTSTQRTAINFMGCYGAFNAIKVADAICRSNPNANVMIVCVELCTIHFQKSMHLDNIISNSLFADGAAAILVQGKPKATRYFTLERFHSEILRETDKEMAWHIGDDGFDIVLSSYIPEIIQSGIAAFTQQLLDKYSIEASEIDFFAIHPGGFKILEACEAALHISKEENRYSYQTLRDYGNMSSATVLFVLKTLWNDLTPQDDQKKIFSCAFGPGLTLESMLLKSHYV